MMILSKRKYVRKGKKDESVFLEQIDANTAAIVEYGNKKKKWTEHDLKHVKALTTSQALLFEAYSEGKNPVAIGSAGTGKTYCALYLALNDILQKTSPRNKIIIVKSSLQLREQGFLPGDLEEKQAPLETPYRDIVHDLIGTNKPYEHMKELGLIEFMTTGFLRGISIDNTVLIIDEIQSMTLHELFSCITRIGKNTKVICCGDFLQNDLQYKRYEESGMKSFIAIIKKVADFSIINFSHDDIVRSKLIKQFIIAYEQTMGVAPT